MAGMSARLADAVFGFLLHPRVVRVRRWSSLVTIPLAIVLLSLVGLEGGFALAAVELAFVLAVLVLFLRLDPERREVVLDFIAPPIERRILRMELAIFATYWRAFARRRRASTGTEWTYHRGSVELAFALALVPAAVGELIVFHLFVPWFWVRVAALVLTVYAFVWLVGLSLGMRVHPHRVGDDEVELRLGVLYRALVPLGAIEKVERRRESVARGNQFVLRDGKAYLAADGRVDVHFALREPVVVSRPIAEPASVREIAVAADDPAGMVRELSKRLGPAKAEG